MSASGTVRQWQYDPASNVVATITPRRDTITMQYDVLNRMTQKITPAVRYEPMTASNGPIAVYSARFPNFADGYSHDWHVRDDPMPPPLIIPGDTTLFTYEVGGALATAVNHNAFIQRLYYPNGSLGTEGQYLRALGSDDDAWPYAGHTFSVGYRPNLNGQVDLRYISAPGNCALGTCVEANTYDHDTGELTAIQDDADVTIQILRHPELRTVLTRAWGNGSVVDQWVQRDADGRAMSRYAGPANAPVFTDTLGYDDANRVIGSATTYPADGQRLTFVENSYSSLGALAGSIRTRAASP